ncbi:hypothetical protein PHLGIDRAFT_109567 [Phlebiopsis gigantea 11061_1 CR5-6]|uniref:DUF7704 domain-containing protein n=1 Tax=Phlebiopsis gigantea (strain 11061_1 CR5-6) TaxID=745531 RepID=A0A0C3S723_PHLG1|nr:hypothetical protein PHLGIDRAFT_109567 [Phlebiopsis gigantea 11061_1 CR5-6]
MAAFPALTGFYLVLFLYVEPFLTALPCLLVWTFPGAAWFHHELIPDGTAPPSSRLEDPRTHMSILQLGNCYLLLGMLSSLVFRAVRDSLPGNPAAQERIIGASLFAMAVADATHIVATWVGLPSDFRYAFRSWNGTTHGNITFVVFLLFSRIAWFAGIGRTRHYFGQKSTVGPTKKLA